jgi:hypothetical protein
VPAPTAIVTLADVKDFIGIPTAQTTKDTVLQRWIDAATAWATYVSDAIIPTTYTNEVHSGGGPTIVLFNTPIVSVTSIIEYVGTTAFALTASEAGVNQTYGYSIDNAAAGIISRRWNGMVGSFIGGRNNVVVTYQAGFNVIPADIVAYVLMDIQVLYNMSQQGRRQGSNGGEQFSSTLPLNAFPRLASLMQSSRRTSAIG